MRVAIDGGAQVSARVYPAGPGSPDGALVLAHGAGAGQESPFIVDFASGIAGAGVDVLTFNFPYVEERRRLPDRQPVLEACYRAVVHAARGELPSAARALFIGGKSMGSRIATHVAAVDRGLRMTGLVLLGYPLHPPGRRDERRDRHLGGVGRPMLFVQGSRDAFGTPAELEPVLALLTPPPTLHVVDGGDHSLKVAGFDRQAQARVHRDVQRAIVDWMRAVARAI
jgi:hypothetical protein